MPATYAPDLLSGIITGNMFPDGMILKDVHPKIKYHEDAKEVGKSLFALQGKEITQKPSISAKFFCYEKQRKGEWMQLNGAIMLENATITVDTVGPLRPDDIVQLWSSDLQAFEQIRVLTVLGSTTFTCTRNYGTSHSGTWADNTKIKIMHNASKEDSFLPTIMNRIPDEEWNSVTLIRTAIGGGLFFTSQKTYTGDPWTDQLIEKWIDHLNERLNNALFSARKWDSTVGIPVGEGIIPAIIRRGGVLKPNLGVISLDGFLAVCKAAFRVGSSKKIMLHCPLMSYALAKWKFKNLFITNEEKYLDFMLTKLVLPGGKQLICIEESKLSGDPDDSPDNLFGGSLLITDPANISYRPLLTTLGTLDGKLLKNRQASDSLSKKEEYITCAGWEWDVITSHLFGSGITGFQE